MEHDAKALARQIVFGQITVAQADAHLVVAALHYERTGAIKGDAIEVAGKTARQMREAVKYRRFHRRLIDHDIRIKVAAMAERRERSNVIRAAVHEINRLNGFQFTEFEVDAIAAEVIADLIARETPYRKRRRHG